MALGLSHLWTRSGSNLFSVYNCLFNGGAEAFVDIEH